MANGPYPVKRANPRFPFSAEAEATLGDGTTVDAQIFELSSRGCYVDTVKPIPVGTELQLRISNGMSRCELQGKVIYSNPGYGTGVFGISVVFNEMAEAQRLAIESWLCDLAGNQTVASPS